MRSLPWLSMLRAAALVGLAASAALLSDYSGDVPSFCSAASGCAELRRSALAQVRLGDLFVPLPGLGVAGFSILYLASLLSRRATQLAAGVGGAIGVYLLSVQAFVLHTFCWLCVTTDVSAIVAAGCAFALPPNVWDQADRSRLRPAAWWALGVLALAAPLAWPLVRLSPPVPPGVAALYQPGKINVVEFADFQCPACRRFHDILKPALAKYGERVHFVRLNKPLSMHPNARDAARASVCAEAQGKVELMADALFAASDLSPRAVDALAAKVGLDAELFERCMLEPATTARVEKESALLAPEEFEGLPTTYIGSKRLLGVQSAETVEDALARAARGEGMKGISGAVYTAIIALVLLLVLRFGLRRAA